MPEVSSLTHREVSVEYSRRSFLAAGVLAALTLPALGQEAQQEKPQLLDAKGRQKLLTRIERIIDSHPDIEQRRAQIAELPPLITQYRESIAHAVDLTPAELSRAVEINRFKINMKHFSAGIEADEAARFIGESSIRFYGELYTIIEAQRAVFPAEKDSLDGSSSAILSDLLWSQNHGIAAVDRSVAEVISDCILNPVRAISLEQIPPCLSYGSPESNPSYYLEVFERRFDTIAEVMKGHSEAVCEGRTDSRNGTVGDLMDTAALTMRWLPAAHKAGLLTDAQMVIWRDRIIEKIETPLFNNLIPLYVAGTAQPPLPITGIMQRFRGPVVVNDDVTGHPLLQKFAPFVNKMERCHVQLGNEFGDSYAAFRTKTTAHRPIDRLGIIPLLAYLSPEPSKKVAIVEDLRALCAEEARRGTDAKLQATLLEVLLFSDQTYAANAQNTAYRSANAVQICVNAMSAADEVAQFKNQITPAQALLVDLVRTGASRHGWKSVPGVRDAPPEERIAQQENAQRVLVEVIKDIYWLARHTSSSDRSDNKYVNIRIPDWWGGSAQSIVETARVPQLTEALRDLTNLADAVTVQLARFDFGRRTEDALLNRLMLLTIALDYRRDIANLPFTTNADPLHTVKEMFPHLWHGVKVGPFADVFHKTRNMLYLSKYRAFPPAEEKAAAREPTVAADKKLDELALSYAQLCEQRFLTSFILRLWNADGARDARPLEGHRILSSDRMLTETRRIFHDYGMLEKYDELRVLLGGKSPDFISGVRNYRDRVVTAQREAFETISGLVERK